MADKDLGQSNIVPQNLGTQECERVEDRDLGQSTLPQALATQEVTLDQGQNKSSLTQPTVEPGMVGELVSDRIQGQALNRATQDGVNNPEHDLDMSIARE